VSAVVLKVWSADDDLLAERRLDAQLRLDDPRPIPLEPGRGYWLRIYRGEGGGAADPWFPVPRDDVAIESLWRGAATEAWEPPPPAATTLHLRIHFQVDNDRPLTKIVRWGFRDDARDQRFRTWRVPFRVRPRLSARAALVFSFAIGLFLGELFEWSTTGLTGREDAPLLEWLQGAGMVFLGTLVLVALGVYVYDFVSLTRAR